MANRGGLTSRQEELLMRHFDGQTRGLGAWRARRLLNTCQEAESFIRDLEQTSGLVKAELSRQPRLHSDLWPAISDRIEQEERAALFLGDRTSKSDKSGWQPLGWGALGGMVAASIGAFVINAGQPAPIPLPSPGPLGSKLESGPPVGLAASAQSMPFGAMPSAMEVDWMRSKGRVRVLHHGDGRSAILWVTRGERDAGRRSLRILPDEAPRALNAYNNK